MRGSPAVAPAGAVSRSRLAPLLHGLPV